MNKGGINIFFLGFIFLFLIMPLGISESYTSDETINVSVRIIDAPLPLLKVNIIENSISLGDLIKGDVSSAKPFNVTNTGDIDAIIQPLTAPHEIFSNLYIGTSRTQGYQKIGEFTGEISKGKKADFWVRLDLKNYTGNLNGDLSAEITFLVMSDE